MESFAYNGLCPNRAMNFNANFTHYTKLMAGNALMSLMRFTVCGWAVLSKGEHGFIDSLSGLTVWFQFQIHYRELQLLSAFASR